jgi:primase-polymerase (primpol)-like protein
MLGDGLACWDLDHVIDDDDRLHPEAAEVLAEIGGTALWIERSMSGRGLHVFVTAPPGPARVGKHASFYSWGRFIAVTGERWR